MLDGDKAAGKGISPEDASRAEGSLLLSFPLADARDDPAPTLRHNNNGIVTQSI